jgi:DNA recombination protein RmuC
MVVVLAAVTAQYVQSKRQQPDGSLSTALQNLTQTVQGTHTQAAVLSQKVEQMEKLPGLVGNVQLELKGLSERLSTVEKNQTTVAGGVNSLQTSIVQAATATNTLVSATKNIQGELTKAQEGLIQLQSNANAREELERASADSIKRLEAIIAGTQSKGSAGENILEHVFSKLPVEWQVRNFTIGNKTVEFGLRLPNELILPIDSKWAATGLIDQFIASEDPAERVSLKAKIEDAVLAKAKEVKKYLEPSLTMSFGIAAVPDAVFDLSSGILPEIYQENVVLISYSMFVPYLLLVFETVLKSSQNIDLEKLGAYLQTAQQSVLAVQEELQGRFSRALTMLGNSRDGMTAHLAKIGSGLMALRITPNNQPTLRELTPTARPVLADVTTEMAV